MQPILNSGSGNFVGLVQVLQDSSNSPKTSSEKCEFQIGPRCESDCKWFFDILRMLTNLVGLTTSSLALHTTYMLMPRLPDIPLMQRLSRSFIKQTDREKPQKPPSTRLPLPKLPCLSVAQSKRTLRKQPQAISACLEEIFFSLKFEGRCKNKERFQRLTKWRNKGADLNV